MELEEDDARQKPTGAEGDLREIASLYIERRGVKAGAR
jgi:hypothetical protein